MTDPLATDPGVEAHPLVVAAHRLAADLLEPAAAAVDAGWVPRSHLDALARAGLLGLLAPTRVGGADVPAPVGRRVQEVLAGADLSTWFVQAQHHTPVRALAVAGGFDPVLTELAAGRSVAGLSFSHLRRPRPAVTATRDGDGWRLDGVAPWYTGWELNDVALLAGVGERAQVVFGLLPARPGAGLAASAPIETAALRSARTVALTLTGCRVPADAVVSVQPLADWARADADRTADVQPAVFGLAGSALQLLDRLGRDRDQPDAVATARQLTDRLLGVRDRAYRLVDEVPPGERAADRLEYRAQAQQLMTDAGTALVIAGAGGSMAVSAPAQRKAREALFLLVQAQTAASRQAALRRWGRLRG